MYIINHIIKYDQRDPSLDMTIDMYLARVRVARLVYNPKLCWLQAWFWVNPSASLLFYFRLVSQKQFSMMVLQVASIPAKCPPKVKVP